jgi:hypothetical protein
MPALDPTQIYNYRTQRPRSAVRIDRHAPSRAGSPQALHGPGSFADYLMFTDKHTLPGGGAIWFTTSGKFGPHAP